MDTTITSLESRWIIIALDAAKPSYSDSRNLHARFEPESFGENNLTFFSKEELKTLERDLLDRQIASYRQEKANKCPNITSLEWFDLLRKVQVHMKRKA